MWTIQNDEEAFISNIKWRKIQDQGLILNTNGYAGTIEVKRSKFLRNIAYI